MAFAAFADADRSHRAGPSAAEPDRAVPAAARHPLPGAVLPGAAGLAGADLASRRRREFGDVGSPDYAFRWENYVEVVSDYWPHIVRSFGYALLATVFALLFSYPLAYFIGVKARRWPLLQSLMLVLVIAPFFISFLLRTLAWKQLLSDESFVITSLKALSLLAPDAHFTGTPARRHLRPDLQLHPVHDPAALHHARAARHRATSRPGSDLYASPATTFRKVTLPLSMPGIVSGHAADVHPGGRRLHQREPRLPRRHRHPDDRQRDRERTSWCCRTIRRPRRCRSS